MTIETENQKSVKGRIVAAAWQLFYEKGYNGTTVDDIIDLSGTSKGSFYYYFNTKDELLNTLSMILDDNYEILIFWHLCILHSLWHRDTDHCWIRTGHIIS